MTAPDDFAIFEDKPLLSEANNNDVWMQFQHLRDAVRRGEEDLGAKGVRNDARTDEHKTKDSPHETTTTPKIPLYFPVGRITMAAIREK
jgi:hypothetical protein